MYYDWCLIKRTKTKAPLQYNFFLFVSVFSLSTFLFVAFSSVLFLFSILRFVRYRNEVILLLVFCNFGLKKKLEFLSCILNYVLNDSNAIILKLIENIIFSEENSFKQKSIGFLTFFYCYFLHTCNVTYKRIDVSTIWHTILDRW